MKILFSMIIGAGAGFAIGYFGRCSTGACPLTGNPWVSSAFGALMGLVVAVGP